MNNSKDWRQNMGRETLEVIQLPIRKDAKIIIKIEGGVLQEVVTNSNILQRIPIILIDLDDQALDPDIVRQVVMTVKEDLDAYL
jgi:ABC-type arginine transport system ATPase subunit